MTRNKRGPNIDPWATPWVRGSELLLVPFQITDCDLPDIYAFNHFRGVPTTPVDSSFFKRGSASIVS